MPVKKQNRPMGSTNSRGRLLVPSLQSYQQNKISIDPTNLPVDMRIERLNLDVVPRHGSGLNVGFKIEQVSAASLILQRPQGDAVAMGSQAFLNGSREVSGWVGYDGRLYLEGLKPDNTVLVKDDGADCTVHFSYAAKADSLPELGPLHCRPPDKP